MKSHSKHRRSGSRPPSPPELLYHSMDRRVFDRLIQGETFTYPNQRTIYASKIREYAWHVAHRTCEEPHVAIIDVLATRRHKIRFHRNRRNLWEVRSVPTSCILNASEHFAEQISAGGIPYRIENGVYKIALIKMHRMYFDSWEIAKGKLEIGENPLLAARREINEEMGANMTLEAPSTWGVPIFFANTTKHPRLKTLHVYLFGVQFFPEFKLATDEGIVDAQWFDEHCHEFGVLSFIDPHYVSMRHILSEKAEASLGPTVDLRDSNVKRTTISNTVQQLWIDPMKSQHQHHWQLR